MPLTFPPNLSNGLCDTEYEYEYEYALYKYSYSIIVTGSVPNLFFPPSHVIL